MRVRIVVMGAGVQTVEAEEGATVGDVLEAQDLEQEGRTISVNGAQVGMEWKLGGNDVITLNTKVEGGI